MANRTCSLGDGKPVKGHGWCSTHYMRWRRYGDPLATKRIIGDVEARWWSHVDRRGDDECWPWTSPPDTEGYGVFGVGQKVVKAMRWGYERYVDPIPDGLMLDHLCHDPGECKLDNDCPHRLCVNYLHHLKIATNRENCLRGARTKLSDEVVTALYARWRAGEKSVDLAAEVDTHRTNLLKRFRRITLAALEPVPDAPPGLLF